jgi:2-amino-4-hydroxy-6-hydroxymethyldihydropteridine diphosphokinase
MGRAFVAVGSNLNSATNVKAALQRLAQETVVRAISTVYLTEPIDHPEQPSYYNCVVEVATELTPLELKTRVLRGIEQMLGREREEDRFAARTIDLDLILYDDLVIDQTKLVLPDPDIMLRPFLAIPLHELAPDLVLPGSRRPVSEVADAFLVNSMEPLLDYTDELRKEILNDGKA